MRNTKKNKIILITLSTILSIGLFFSSTVCAQENIISAEQLNKIIDDDSVVIVDVRREKHWNDSESKIKNAVRLSPDEFDAWSGNLPKEKTLVLYCA